MIKKSYSPLLLERTPEIRCIENNMEISKEVAYTSFNSTQQKYNISTRCHKYCDDIMNMTVVGNDLAPVINSNQEITVGPIASIRNFVSAKAILAIIKIAKNSSLNNKAAIRLCRYMSCTNDKVILTTSQNQAQPYALSHYEVEEIQPIKAVLWN